MILDCGPLSDTRQIKLEIPQDKSIALTLSGGADTALLAYLVCKELLDTGRRPEDYVKWTFTIPKRDGAELFPPQILQWISAQLNVTLPNMTLVRIPQLHSTWHGHQVWHSVLYMLDTYAPDTLYMGDQRTPPESANLDGPAPVRSKTLEGPLPGRVFFPFNHVNKTHTVDAFYKLGIEDLLTLTHSCTQSPTGRCNKCWHCNERAWAFGELGIADPGKL
jgi:hypothetical protein